MGNTLCYDTVRIIGADLTAYEIIQCTQVDPVANRLIRQIQWTHDMLDLRFYDVETLSKILSMYKFTQLDLSYTLITDRFAADLTEVSNLKMIGCLGVTDHFIQNKIPKCRRLDLTHCLGVRGFCFGADRSWDYLRVSGCDFTLPSDVKVLYLSDSVTTKGLEPIHISSIKHICHCFDPDMKMSRRKLLIRLYIRDKYEICAKHLSDSESRDILLNNVFFQNIDSLIKDHPKKFNNFKNDDDLSGKLDDLKNFNLRQPHDFATFKGYDPLCVRNKIVDGSADQEITYMFGNRINPVNPIYNLDDILDNPDITFIGKKKYYYDNVLLNDIVELTYFPNHHVANNFYSLHPIDQLKKSVNPSADTTAIPTNTLNTYVEKFIKHRESDNKLKHKPFVNRQITETIMSRTEIDERIREYDERTELYNKSVTLFGTKTHNNVELNKLFRIQTRDKIRNIKENLYVRPVKSLCFDRTRKSGPSFYHAESEPIKWDGSTVEIPDNVWPSRENGCHEKFPPSFVNKPFHELKDISTSLDNLAYHRHCALLGKGREVILR